MKLLEILKNNGELFIVDDIEDKKTKALVKDINTSILNLYTEYKDFLTFAANQLSGEYHQKLVYLKSLYDHYDDWNGIKLAFNNAKKEEENKINKLYSNKTTLINKLKSLQLDCQKSLPVISVYHLSNGELVNSRAEHETIILGNHNANIIEDIISELDKDIVVTGNFEKVGQMELNVNFTIVDNNVELCANRIEELFANKPAKADKITSIVDSMVLAAENLVFFETYKSTLLDVGCSNKDVDVFEKDLLKKYVPLKKQLQKLLKVSFEDICNIVVDENDYQIEESESFDSLDGTSNVEISPSVSQESFLNDYSFDEGSNVPTPTPPQEETPFDLEVPSIDEEAPSSPSLSDDFDIGIDFTDEESPSEPPVEETPIPTEEKPKKTTKKSKKVEIEEKTPQEDNPFGDLDFDEINPLDIDTPLNTDDN